MRYIGVGVMLLFAAILGIRLGLSHDEALMLWIVRDDSELALSSESLRDLRADVAQFVDRVREAPPLYPAVLDVWEKIAGESLSVLRWLSLLFVLIGMAVNYRQSWIAAPLLLYPAMAAYGYGLLFMLASLAWISKRKWAQTGFIMLAMLTDPFGGAVLLIMVLVFRQRSMIYTLSLPVLVVTLLLFESPLKPMNLLMAVLPGVIQYVYGLFASGKMAQDMARLDMARHVPTVMIIVGGVVLNVLSLGGHPDWLGAIHDLNMQRNLTDVTIIDYDARHPLAYYERHEVVRQGVSLDFGWRDFSPEEIDAILSRIHSPIWLIVLQWQGDIVLIDEVGSVQFARLQ